MPTVTVVPINLTKLSNRLQLSLEKLDFSTVLMVNLNVYPNQELRCKQTEYEQPTPFANTCAQGLGIAS